MRGKRFRVSSQCQELYIYAYGQVVSGSGDDDGVPYRSYR